jgi:hypothetical protein
MDSRKKAATKASEGGVLGLRRFLGETLSMARAGAVLSQPVISIPLIGPL